MGCCGAWRCGSVSWFGVADEVDGLDCYGACIWQKMRVVCRRGGRGLNLDYVKLSVSVVLSECAWILVVLFRRSKY